VAIEVRGEGCNHQKSSPTPADSRRNSAHRGAREGAYPRKSEWRAVIILWTEGGGDRRRKMSGAFSRWSTAGHKLEEILSEIAEISRPTRDTDDVPKAG
jgi:hypothetical protein